MNLFPAKSIEFIVVLSYLLLEVSNDFGSQPLCYNSPSLIDQTNV